MSYDLSKKISHQTNHLIDLRSDTVTRPSVEMRRIMADAEVGDDVYGEDPTINKLEKMLAERLGKDTGVLMTSGTQSNLCSVLSHCARGEEIIIGNSYHVYIDEAWIDKLPQKDDGEEDMLDMAFEPKKNSRLSCQIIVSDELDGLIVNIPSKQG